MTSGLLKGGQIHAQTSSIALSENGCVVRQMEESLLQAPLEISWTKLLGDKNSKTNSRG